MVSPGVSEHSSLPWELRLEGMDLGWGKFTGERERQWSRGEPDLGSAECEYLGWSPNKVPGAEQGGALETHPSTTASSLPTRHSSELGTIPARGQEEATFASE